MTTAAPIHPAVFQLLALQSRGRVRRMWRRMCLPRRMALTAVACLLAAVWLGNALVTIWLREAASRETLCAMLSLGFATYALWHFTKAAFFRPVAAFDWKPAEWELLSTCPLRPRDLVGYQLASVALPTFLKGGLFALLLLPDLPNVFLGLCGILLGLYLLEVLRIEVEIVAWGMARSTFLVYRTVVVAGLLSLGTWVTWWILQGPRDARIDIGEGITDRFVEILVQFAASPAGYATLPFRPIVEVITAESLTAGAVGWSVVAVGVVAALSACTVWSFGRLDQRRKDRERAAYQVRSMTSAAAESPTPVRPLTRLPRCGGAGPLAWRQFLGARRHWGSLLTAMIAPAVLAVTPCFVVEDPLNAFLATAGALAFYTFLLLPTALRFDFRRDLDYLATLKGLPIKPAAAVLGQTLAPVVITTVFQAAVLAFAIVVRGQPLHYLPATLLVFVPMNGLVFGLDNLIYLLYPYRVQQEGVEIFLRTMLTFTGKGLLFALGVGAMSVWGFLAAVLTRMLATSTWLPLNAYAVFTTGMVAGTLLLAAVTLWGVCRTYRRLDPIEDLPR